MAPETLGTPVCIKLKERPRYSNAPKMQGELCANHHFLRQAKEKHAVLSLLQLTFQQCQRVD